MGWLVFSAALEPELLVVFLAQWLVLASLPLLEFFTAGVLVRTYYGFIENSGVSFHQISDWPCANPTASETRPATSRALVSGLCLHA